MRRRVKILLVVIVFVIAALFTCAAVIYRHWAYHPATIIDRVVYEDGEDRHIEMFSMVMSGSDKIPYAKVLQESLSEYLEWQRQVEDDLYKYHFEYDTPCDIRVSAEVKDGKTVFRYEGYVTAPDGERIDYKNEKVIDYVFVSNDELFVKRNLSWVAVYLPFGA